ncbi:hypothetical protein AAE478_002622 [Parahypoxylon ruwenzoriense]
MPVLYPEIIADVEIGQQAGRLDELLLCAAVMGASSFATFTLPHVDLLMSSYFSDALFMCWHTSQFSRPWGDRHYKKSRVRNSNTTNVSSAGVDLSVAAAEVFSIN